MVLDRYIFKLWFGPFIGMLLVVTGILLLGRVLKLLGLFADKGVEWGIMLTMLMAILPYFLVLTVPIAFFFAMQMMIIKLYQNSEMDALRAAGLSYVRIFRAMFMVVLVLWLGLTWTAMEWMPQGQKAFQSLLVAVQKVKPAPGFEAQRFGQDLDDFTVYVNGKDEDGVFHGFMLEDRRSTIPVVYLSESAALERVGGELRFTLHHGTRLEGENANLRSLAFDRYQISMNLGDLGLLKIPSWNNHIAEMRSFELLAEIKVGKKGEALIELNWRLLMPTTILALALLCLPLSYAPKRSGKSMAYLLGLTSIVLIYNVQTVMHQSALQGQLSWLSMWCGQISIVALSAWLFSRACSNKRIFVI